MSEKQKKWTEEAVKTLLSSVGSASPVPADRVEKAAVVLGVSARSVAAKLRQLDREVASMAKEKTSAFTTEEGDALSKFVNSNSGRFTYKEIAEQFMNGKFTAKQIQGKLLALELTSAVKPAEKVEAARSYSESEEQKFISLVKQGKFIEDIAESLGKTIASVRGKALSLTRSGVIDSIPAQRESHANSQVDPVTALGDKIVEMTVTGST